MFKKRKQEESKLKEEEVRNEESNDEEAAADEAADETADEAAGETDNETSDDDSDDDLDEGTEEDSGEDNVEAPEEDAEDVASEESVGEPDEEGVSSVTLEEAYCLGAGIDKETLGKAKALLGEIAEAVNSNAFNPQILKLAIRMLNHDSAKAASIPHFSGTKGMVTIGGNSIFDVARGVK